MTTENLQLDVNKIIESLVAQISLQAQRIAVLEATIDSLKKSIASTTVAETSE